MEKSFGNCYFEFHVQILFTPSFLQNEAHNIRPLRNQFQMLFVTNKGLEVWRIWSRSGWEGIEQEIYRPGTTISDASNLCTVLLTSKIESKFL